MVRGGHGVVPLRVRDRDSLLEVARLRVVAYRAWCSCDWRGPSRKTVSFARADLRWHECPPIPLAAALTPSPPTPTSE